MAKRLSDTDKWKKPFFKSLPTEYKLFWLYLLDDCDHAGVWHVDIEVAELRLGTKLSLQKAQGYFSKNIVVLDGGTKWFIPDFISFQYGAFNEDNKMFKSILPVLNKYDLIPLLSPIYGVKVKEKEMVQVTVKDTEDSSKEKDRQDFLTNQAWKEQFCMSKGITMVQLEKQQLEWLADIDLSGKHVDSYKRYFLNCYNRNPVSNRPKKMVQ
jgi:hypothetical protein